MLRTQKEAVVEDVKTALSEAAGVLFLDFTGLTVAQADDFRRTLQKAGVRYSVVKNTLMKRAMEGTTYADAAAFLKGTPTGVVFGAEDPVASAKVTFEFLKGCDKLRIKGGVLDAKAIDAAQAEALSKMPGRQELQATVVALALSPGRNVAGQIKNPAGRIVGAIETLIENLEKEQGAA